MTKIAVQSGVKAAKDIHPGDMVWTHDNGYQPVRWVGHSTVKALGAFAPVVIAPGAIGNDDELVVSQQHRILIQDAAELLFGVNEVLIAAKHLCGLPGIGQRPGGSVTYVHLMCYQHQIICSKGIESESFLLSNLSISGAEADQKRELLALFPSLKAGMESFNETATPILKGFEATAFCNYLQADRVAH